MKKFLVAIIAAIVLFISTCSASVIDEALLHLGEPYRYAHAGPDSFDCSGLVFYCYKTVENIELKRTAKEIGYDETYQKIEKKYDLRAGDVVCFNTNKGDSDLSDHVGLYIGSGNFIHCSSGRKSGVIISTLWNGYYYERFSWGRRIIGGIK